MSVWTYRLGHDWGFAPNPFFGVCTLACCKSNIRQYAKEDDYVFGVGGADSKRPNRAIFWMKIDRIMSMDDYWHAAEFQRKKPAPNAPLKRWVGDNIYHHDETGRYVQDDSFHALSGGFVNADTLNSDTGRAGHRDRVLIGSEFTYWGGDGPMVPDHLRQFICENRDREKRTNLQEVAAFVDWINALPRGRVGWPTEWNYQDPRFFKPPPLVLNAA